MIASLFVRAQFYNLPNDYFFSLLTERELAKKDTVLLHNGIKPYIHFFSKKFVHIADSFRVFKYITDDPGLDFAFYKHALSLQPKQENFAIHVDPIIGLQLGRDALDTLTKGLLMNSRGIIANVSVGKDFYAESMFVENQAYLPYYLDIYAKSTGIIPGQGRYKVFKVTGYDYAFSSGFISYSPWKCFNFQMGHGKHKIGNGYRSLLLSDNSFNYPYMRVTQNWFNGRLQYTNIYALLMNLVPSTLKPIPNAERLFQKKPAAFQYLSLNVSKALNIALFQGIIWRAGNVINRPQIDLMYANPVIFSQAGYYGLSNPNNVILGADLKAKVTNQITLYAQGMVDRLNDTTAWGNGYGFQVGLNYFNAFGIKNLFLQAEYNSVSKGAYSSPYGSETDQSYSHYNQNLAYTPGTGNEIVLIGDYKYHRLNVNCRYYLQSKYYTQIDKSQINIVNVNIAYLVNPAYNLNVFVGYNYRYQKFYNFNPATTSSWLYLGFKTSLFNVYYDF